MTIDEMFNELKNKVRDTYIVILKYKYDFEKNYTIENHILEYDSTVDRYDWLDDWYEGQTDVEVLGYRLLSDIDNTKIEPCEDCIRVKKAWRLGYERGIYNATIHEGFTPVAWYTLSDYEIKKVEEKIKALKYKEGEDE